MKLLIAFFIFIFCCVDVFGAEKMPPKEPDYLKGEKLDGRIIYWNLGPIGATGDIWHKRGYNGTDKTRKIQIREVFKGTPADGKLKMKDVILGVAFPRISQAVDSQKNFTRDAPQTLSLAITEAEKKGNSGKLILKVWRPETKITMWQHPKRKRQKPVPKAELVMPIKGKVITVTLKLPVKDTFSSTSPYKCPKTEQLIKDAVTHIKKETKAMDSNIITGSLMCLGLLATGDKGHWKIVGDYVKRHGKKSAEEFRTARLWSTMYLNLLATEYYLCTKDQSVLPIVKKISHTIAIGRSGVGTWSHGLTDLKQNHGKPYGIACAYGAMNQVTLTCALSLVLAQKCGIKDSVIDTAVKKSVNYLRFYYEKGCLPYGDHAPGRVHNNNGSSPQAAVLFSILGDKDAAGYFTRITLASKRDQEKGHTGPFFNRLWSPLGAGCGGRYAQVEFAKVTRWRKELMRRSKGSFPYQFAFGEEDKGRYNGWDTTGCRLLEFCLPRKQLYITGKGGYAIQELSLGKVRYAIASGDISSSNKTTSELVKQLSHWSPVIRKAAANTLGKEKKVLEEAQILSMLSSNNKYTRYGAALAAKHVGNGSVKIVDRLAELTKDKSLTMRFFALMGLSALERRKNENYDQGLRSTAGRAVPHLIQALTNKNTGEYRAWTKIYATFVLFGQSKSEGLLTKNYWDKMSSEQRVDLVRNVLKLDHGGARSAMATCYTYMNKNETARLLKEIYDSVKTPAPSGVMFNKEGRSGGLEILAKNHIKEGLQLGMDYMFEYGHGGHARRTTGVGALKHYGQLLPETFVDKLQRALKNERSKAVKGALKEMKEISEPKLVSMDEFIMKYLEKNK